MGDLYKNHPLDIEDILILKYCISFVPLPSIIRFLQI